jgi:hypothetical protein
MVKIVETNVSKLGDYIVDHQSRIVEFLSWRDYKKQFIFYGDIQRKEPLSCEGSQGHSIPENARVTKLKHDDRKLYCEFNTMYHDSVFMAYLIETN